MKEVLICRSPSGFTLPSSIVEEFYRLNSCNDFYDLYPLNYFKDWNPISTCKLVFIKDNDILKILATSKKQVREHVDLIDIIRRNQAVLKDIKIVEIPDDVEYDIVENEYGIEFIAEKHRVWY